MCCVDCGGGLVADAPVRLVCEACGRSFPVVLGIPDLRADPAWFDVEADRRLAVELVEAAEHEDLDGLLRRLWAAHPEVSARAAERFVYGDLSAAERAEQVADQIYESAGHLAEGARVLEVGCGTAALSVALAPRAGEVVATDVSLAWLVLARHRALRAGAANVTFAACSADRLPLAPGTIDLVVAADVIEHVPDPAAFAASCHRVLRPGGALWLSTPNRFSLTPEPHVQLWAVGYLPRSVGVWYVRRARGVAYQEIRPLSRRALAGVLESTGGEDVTVVAPPILGPPRSRWGRPGRALIQVYNTVSSTPLLRRVVRPIAPLFHATVRKGVEETSPGGGDAQAVARAQPLAGDARHTP